MDDKDRDTSYPGITALHEIQTVNKKIRIEVPTDLFFDYLQKNE